MTTLLNVLGVIVLIPFALSVAFLALFLFVFLTVLGLQMIKGAAKAVVRLIKKPFKR